MTMPSTQEGRRNRLDSLLNRLEDAQASIMFHQRESERLRKEIHEFLGVIDQSAKPAPKETEPYRYEAGDGHP